MTAKDCKNYLSEYMLQQIDSDDAEQFCLRIYYSGEFTNLNDSWLEELEQLPDASKNIMQDIDILFGYLSEQGLRSEQCCLNVNVDGKEFLVYDVDMQQYVPIVFSWSGSTRSTSKFSAKIHKITFSNNYCEVILQNFDATQQASLSSSLETFGLQAASVASDFSPAGLISSRML